MEYQMPNNIEINSLEVEEFDDSEEFSQDDFGFILGPDGNLKSFVVPKHLMEDPPEEVLLILKLFGIDDIHDLGNQTVH
jgi:hypothetical protein